MYHTHVALSTCSILHAHCLCPDRKARGEENGSCFGAENKAESSAGKAGMKFDKEKRVCLKRRDRKGAEAHFIESTSAAAAAAAG